MRRRYRLDCSTAEIVAEIKATLHLPVQPHGLAVLQVLQDREREKVFNRLAAKTSPEIRQEFEHAIQDHVTGRAGRVPARRTRKIADNSWKQDPAADRRIRERKDQPPRPWHSPYRGQPEIYDPEVVLVFADAIRRIAGRQKFSVGHHGDQAITDKNKGGSPMLRVLVASVQWAMIAAWQTAAPPGTPPGTVKPEGILTVIKRRSSARSTD
jgi:hypothetical protein